MNKFILLGLAVVIVGIGLLAYGILTLDVGHDINVEVKNPEAAAGDQFTTSRIAQTEWDASTTATNTPASLLNSSGRDRLITGIKLFVEGADGFSQDQCCGNLAALVFDVATSTGSGAFGSRGTGTRSILHTNISTSTAGTIGEYISSTSPGYVSAVPGVRYWPNGAYLNLITSAVASSTSGWLAVEYLILD